MIGQLYGHHVKAKQEITFPHSEGTHTRWKDYSRLTRLVIQFLWCFDIKVLFVKLLTRLQIV